VGNGGGVSHPLYFHVALYRLDNRFTVKIAGLYSEFMVCEFPKIETQADNNGKLGVNAGEIPGYNGIEGSDNGELSGIFLGKIAECKKFNFHRLQDNLIF
jgi:hypothetical protein